MPVEEVLVGADQEGAGSARGIQNAEFRCLLRRVVLLENRAYGLLHDVVHDVGRRVVDAARLADLRLLFDSGLVTPRQPDHLSEKLFVDLAQDVGRKNRELVGAVWVVEVAEDIFQDLVVDLKRESQLVDCTIGPIFFVLEVE